MKTLKKLFLFLLVVSFASCDVGDDEELNYGSGNYVAQFPFAEKTAFFLKDDAVVYDYDMPIEIVGGNGLALNTDTTVTFEIDNTTLTDHDEDPSTPPVPVNTAVEGVNFDFVGSNTLVIPAGSTFATIPLKVYSGTLDDQNPPVLLLKLTNVDGGANVVTSGNKGSVALTFQGTCISDLAGTYNTVTVRYDIPGGPYSMFGEIITEEEAGTYLTTATGNFKLPTTTQVTVGPWNAANPGNRGGFIFKEVCGRIALEQQNLFNTYSNIVWQTPAQYAASSVNNATGVITIEYYVNAGGVNRLFRGIYTPI